MKNVLFVIALLLSVSAQAHNTDETISDSIKIGMAALGYDTTIETHNVFWKDGVEWVHLSQIPGGMFRAISHTNRPEAFVWNAPYMARAWHEKEIDNWLAGTFGANYEGYACYDAALIRNCIITISGDEWDGTAALDHDAMGRAFYALLFDPDFLTYIP